MSDYTGRMVYRRWRSTLKTRGEALAWRIECQFYGMLGMFYLMDLAP
jgi:hypothetical protein